MFFLDNNLNSNIEENTVENGANPDIIETDGNNDSGNKFFRGLLTAAVSVSFVVFVYLLIYFCENTGA